MIFTFSQSFFNNFIFLYYVADVLNKYVTYVVIISNAYLLGINTPLIIMLQMGAVSVLTSWRDRVFGFFLGALIGLKSIEYHVANVKNTKLILLLGIIAIFLGALVEAYITAIFNDLNKENYYAGNFEVTDVNFERSDLVSTT